MAEELTPEHWLASLDAEKIYTELCTDIRATDNASFRLLGLVPLVSGTALIGLVLKQNLPPGLILLLSLFAAGITFGLFRWELRNIQTCSWLIKSAYVVERVALESTRDARAVPRAPRRSSENWRNRGGEIHLRGHRPRMAGASVWSGCYTLTPGRRRLGVLSRGRRDPLPHRSFAICGNARAALPDERAVRSRHSTEFFGYSFISPR